MRFLVESKLSHFIARYSARALLEPGRLDFSVGMAQGD